MKKRQTSLMIAILAVVLTVPILTCWPTRYIILEEPSGMYRVQRRTGISERYTYTNRFEGAKEAIDFINTKDESQWKLAGSN